MSHFKQIPATVVAALLVVAGVAAALAGVYLLTGLAVTLVVGGAGAVVTGLLVDVD